MGKRKEEHEKENSERWLLTYSDMITLLMALFIVLYSMSNIDQEKYEALAEGLQQAFEGGDFGIFEMKSGGGGILEGVEKPAPSNAKQKGEAKARMLERVKSLIQGNNMDAMESSDGITITIYADLHFGAGSSQISDEGYDAIRSMVPALLEVTNKIRVAGHTDATPVPPGADYTSNWQLSADRALAVMAALLQYGVPEDRLSIAAYGATRPIRSNDTPEGKAYNRRVEVIVLFDQAQ